MLLLCITEFIKQKGIIKKTHGRVNVLVSEDSRLMLKQTFFLSPSFPSPSYSLPRSLHSHHATDELKESMSVGRQGGEKRKKEDIRKNSFSEFLNKNRALALHRLVGFRGSKAVIWVNDERSTFCPLNRGQQKPDKIQNIDKLLIPIRTTRPQCPQGASFLTSSTKHMYCI